MFLENVTKLVSPNNSGIANTTPPEDCKDSFELIFGILYAFIGLIILVGNGFSCVVFLATENLRRQYMNIFLVSLAISDILMAILVAPLFATHCSLGCTTSNMADYCWLMRKPKDIVLIANMFNLFAVTYDRYLAVLRSLQYTSKMTRKRVTIILVAVWVVPGVLAGLRNAWQHTAPSQYLRRTNKHYDGIIIIVFIILPIFVMTVVNIRIVRAIKRQSHRIRGATQRNVRRSHGARSSKGTMACVSVVFIFVVCWLPRCVYNISYLFREGSNGLASPLLFKVAFLFLFLQSSVNPFVYSFYRSDFRRAALSLIKRR